MRILLLGGSKFMGLDFLIKLLSIQNIEIYVINRGKIHWNGLFYKILNENSNVFHTICDRDDDIQFKLKLKEIKAVISKRSDMSKQNCQYFDYIVDFSCFEKHDAKVLLEELAKKFKYYIFISTDSVYNASEVSLIRTDKFFLSNKVSNYDLINEKLGYMAESKEVRKKLKRNDSYGYNKLKCEIFLKKYFAHYTESKYIILRLPDVIGTFDESFRMWYYVEWIKYSDLRKIEFDKIDLERPLSFVLKDNVTDLLYSLIITEKHDENILNQEYNLAHDEIYTLKELVDVVSEILNIKYDYTVVDGLSKSYYPSVSIGPISNEKAKKYLNWKPSPIKLAIEMSVNFFKNEGGKYEKEYEKMKKDLPSEIRNK